MVIKIWMLKDEQEESFSRETLFAKDYFINGFLKNITRQVFKENPKPALKT